MYETVSTHAYAFTLTAMQCRMHAYDGLRLCTHYAHTALHAPVPLPCLRTPHRLTADPGFQAASPPDPHPPQPRQFRQTRSRVGLLPRRHLSIAICRIYSSMRAPVCASDAPSPPHCVHGCSVFALHCSTDGGLLRACAAHVHAHVLSWWTAWRAAERCATALRAAISTSLVDGCAKTRVKMYVGHSSRGTCGG